LTLSPNNPIVDGCWTLDCFWRREADETRNTNVEYKVIDHNEERDCQTAPFQTKQVPLM